MDFESDLAGILPRLRIYALSLTRNAESTDELVQQTALKALAGRASFRAGSNFSAWLFRIQRNEFISGLRRMRPTVDIDSPAAQAWSCAPAQEKGIVMREFMAAFRQLPHTRRHALLMTTLEDLPQAEIADCAGVAVGAIKSRIWRGRKRLKQLLEPQFGPPAKRLVPLGSKRTVKCLFS